MTNRRPSLLQARSGPHAHAHSAYKLGHAHGHGQHLHHQYPHDAVAGPRPDDIKPDNAQAPDLDNRAAVVVQTVSLVQIVDTRGSPIETQTRFAIPNTVVVDKNTGKTISASNPDHTAAPAVPGSSPGSSGGISSSTSSTGSQTNATPIAPSSASSSGSSSESSSGSSSGSPPVSSSASSSVALSVSPPASLSPPAHSSPPTAPPAPSLGIGHNGTNIHHSIHHNATNSLFHAESVNNTASSTKFSSTTTRHHTSSTTSEVSSSQFTSFSETFISAATSSFEPAPTDGAFGGVFGGDSAPTASGAAPTTSSSSNSTDSALSPQQKQVIGGVVGGLAGAAFFLVLVLLALRYKRRQLNAAQAASQPTSESRELPPATGAPNGAPSGGNGGGNGGAMAERYGAAALTAAFAGLSPKTSSASANSADTGERGFYRVSGRKLPSVLQVGGDGYSDPRASFMSGTSDWNRGSQAFDPFGGPGARLQLGVPMRPDSGVPVVRSGPARAVVAESNPFADPPRTPPADASVPPMMRQRESPGRGSRFQEGL
ncbi:hypothetical protein T069G_09486 [Trichoderma breve]|uniref:Uncharacterized protein n=1 Tax=Trichoderma breve TaxID=2034170 RepID=A0A9W9B4J5_9HYPO|nr:hypothetical protein T069G_09486 [Trichoderma breve]KAJ4856118.1 hypothetical protein T069G_09486 [Trichoderma breve]